MVRRVIILTLSLIFLTSATGMAFAMEKGKKRKGKYTYRKVYQACFERGEVESKTPFISPADKTQAEWDALFQGGDLSEFKCGPDWGDLSETDVADIYAYMHGGASDSPTPARCK